VTGLNRPNKEYRSNSWKENRLNRCFLLTGQIVSLNSYQVFLFHCRNVFKGNFKTFLGEFGFLPNMSYLIIILSGTTSVTKKKESGTIYI